MKWFILLVCALYFCNISNGKPAQQQEEDTYGDLVDEDLQNDGEDDPRDYYDTPADNDEDNGVDVDKDQGNIVITSKPLTKTIKLHQVVTLPCEASHSDQVRVWYKGEDLIFQDELNIKNKPNWHRDNNGSLQITVEDLDEDSGEYICKLLITEENKPSIVHNLIASAEPRITKLFANKQPANYNEKDEVVLTCIAVGDPKPKIKWQREEEPIAVSSEQLIISNIRPKQAGRYRCLADNQIEPPAHEYITVTVNHAPMLNVEKYVVNSDHMSSAELICGVNAHPNATIVWKHNGVQVEENKPRISFKDDTHNGNYRHYLIIKDLTDEDFGAYNCEARNSLGRSHKTLHLVRTPSMTGLGKSHETDKDITLEWKVESKQPISSHEFQYRRKGETDWKTMTPEVAEKDENNVYKIKHMLKNLEPGTYETRVRSQNSNGWSNYSEIIAFERAKHGIQHHHHKSANKHAKKEHKEQSTLQNVGPANQRANEINPTVGEATASGSQSVRFSITLLLAALFALKVRQ